MVAHSYAAPGTYPISLTVVDSGGNQHQKTGSVTVQEAPPVADFTVSCGILDCSFDGSSSSDDTGIVAYAWDFGDAQVGSGVAADHTFAANGTYAVNLQVTDGSGKTGTVTQQVTVAEQPPIASLSVSCVGLSCSFDGTASSDDTGIVSYQWTFGDGDSGSGEVAQHVYGSSGSFDVQLEVEDGSSLLGVDTSSVVLDPAAEGTWLLHPLSMRGSYAGRSSTEMPRGPDRIDLLTGNVTVQLPLGIEYPLRSGWATPSL